MAGAVHYPEMAELRLRQAVFRLHLEVFLHRYLEVFLHRHLAAFRLRLEVFLLHLEVFLLHPEEFLLRLAVSLHRYPAASAE
jgi:hypothetical protein